jgi:4-amino-4-deoxy-L-arabinose transferase-like glycosyltransferase
MAVFTEPRQLSSAFSLSGFVAFATMSHRRALAALVLVSLLAFLPGFFQIPPVDRDEARFAQATKQMIESGDYVDIRFQEESRYKKPVGVYWLQAIVVKAAEAAGVPQARTRIGLYRIPSLLGAVGAVLLTYWSALALVSRRAALIAGLIMATSILLGVEARLAKTDAMLLLSVVAAMGALGRAYVTREEGAGHSLTLPAIFWTALAGGVLLKGPLILLFVGLPIATLVVIDRSWRWLARLKPGFGIAWMLLLVLPWFLAIVLRAGDSFFAESLGRDLFAKVGSIQESHGGPPGVYFLLFWVTFFPAAVLAPLAAPAVWRARSEPATKLLLAWLVPCWIAFEIAVTKLPHYVLPLYPAMAILIAGAVDANQLSRNKWLERGTLWWFVLTALIAIGIIATHIVVGQQFGLVAWLFAAAAVIFALFAWWLYDVDGTERSLFRAMAASILVSFAAFGATFPGIPGLFPSVALAEVVRRADCNRPMVVTAGYHEPSLVFLTGTELEHVDGAHAAEFLRAGGCRFAFVESRQERWFVQWADAVGLRYAPGVRVDGFNLSTGRAVSIAVYRAIGDAP